MKQAVLPLLLVWSALSACGSSDKVNTSAAAPPPERGEPVGAKLPSVTATDVSDRTAVERLRGNAGLTLQWIGWKKRGELEVRQDGNVVRLDGKQVAAEGKGRLEIEGDILSIDSTRFIFRGRIEITDTPDEGRRCIKDGDSEFAITQGRRYWRMREFEWCDQLTDYIDIYF